MKKKVLKQIRTEQARYINHLVEKLEAARDKIAQYQDIEDRREWYRNEFRDMADAAIEAETIPMGIDNVLFLDEITPSEEQVKTMHMATLAMLKERMRKDWPVVDGLMYIPAHMYGNATADGTCAKLSECMLKRFDPTDFLGVPTENI